MLKAHAKYNHNPSKKRADALATAVGDFIRDKAYKESEDEDDDDEEEEDTCILTNQLGVEIVSTPAQGGILIDGMMFPTVMHAFQSHKYCFTEKGFDLAANKEKRNLFVSCNLSDAIAMGKQHIPHFDNATWEQKRDDIMKGILVHLNVDLRPAKDKTIWQLGIDNYWGNANTGGQNRVGKLLETIRDEQAAKDAARASKKTKRA